jgi:CubicO group peptidase (beta-lactamase class C family)
MRELLFEPLGLTRTVTLPEDVARHRYAWGHSSDPGERPAAVPIWDDGRALAPAGAICASAADLLAFARLHLDGGVAPDGTRLLSEESVREMQRIHVDVPEPWATGPHWGLGWIRHQYDGRQLFGHDGNTIGQNAYLLAVPDRDVAITLLTNVSSAHELSVEVYRELLSELCDIDVPPWPSPVENGHEPPPDVVGSYQRYGIRIDIERAAEALTATAQIVEPLASQSPIKQDPITFDLRPTTVGGDVFVARRPGDPTWLPVVFFKVDGDRYVHMGARAQRRVEVAS